jgi:hypothetical protein
LREEGFIWLRKIGLGWWSVRIMNARRKNVSVFRDKKANDGGGMLASKQKVEAGRLSKSVPFVICVVTAMLFVVFAPSAVMGLPINEAREAIGDQLVAGQGPDGAWLGEEGYTGSIVAGLAHAYEVTEKADYKAAAELGGNYIINSAGGNFYGDEAYALARLSDITGDPTYADAARNFYEGLDTYEYIRGFRETDRSNAVFYLAQHTVAADKVGATDAGIWRDSLIQYLSRVGDDTAYYPVMSLGVATWALSQTGPMDDTRIDPFSLIGEDYWTDVTLSDLPELLSGHQVLLGEYPGTFYHRFDHTAAGEGFEASGYTEDTIFGLLGLLAADDAGWDFDVQTIGGIAVLTWPVTSDGVIYEHIWSGGAAYYTYGGELLQVIPEPASLFLLVAGALLLRRRKRHLG